MIATLVVFGGADDAAAAGGDAGVGIGRRQRAAVRRAGAGGAARRAGSALRARHRRPSTCAIVTRNFVPVFISRGVVQVSAYIDALLASLLPTGAVTGLSNAQLLYTLPVSLFGMSVAAAELPAMSGDRGVDAPDGRCGGGSIAGCARSRSSSSRRRWRFSRSATSSPPRCCRPDGSATRTRSTSGASSPGRRSGCWRRRSAACTRRPTTRCATRGRRCATRSSASC